MTGLGREGEFVVPKSGLWLEILTKRAEGQRNQPNSGPSKVDVPSRHDKPLAYAELLHNGSV